VSGEARAGLRAARASAAAGARASDRQLDAAAFEALTSFARARAAEESLEVLGGLLADLARDVALSDRLKEAGLVTAAEPARARAGVAETEAERAAIEAARRRARADLARLAGTDTAARPLLPLPRPAAPSGEISAPRERDDVASARLSATAARANAEAARAARLPSLYAAARWELHAARPLGRYGDSASVAAGLRIPVFASGALDAAVAAAGAQRRAADAVARDAAERAVADLEEARATLTAATRSVEALEHAGAAARTAREIQQARYEQGAARLVDLLDARMAEARAGLGAIAARADEAVAAQALRLALGLAPEVTEEKAP